MGVCSFPYCSVLVVLASMHVCLQVTPIIQVQIIKGELFVEQVTGGIYKYVYSNRLFITLGKVNHNAAEDLRSFLNYWDQNGSELQPLADHSEYL